MGKEGSSGVGRVLGLDLGHKTIGMAVSDPTNSFAMSIGVIRRKGMESDLAELGRVIAERGVGEIVLGLPLHLSGAESAGSRKSRVFAEKLSTAFGLPIRLVDESLSTRAAEEVLVEANVSRRKRKKSVDGLAAAMILQSYLNEVHEKS